MSAIEVELNAYVIPDDHHVFKCSPGKTYRFYELVRDSNVVFPDIRGLESLGEDLRSWTDSAMLRAINQDRWAREMESRAKGNEPIGSEAVSPTDKKNLAFLRRLFFEAKKGDLVVVPAGGYDKDVLIGEFTTGPGTVRRVEAQDGEFFGLFIGRPVKWRNRIQKRLLHPDLVDVLHYRDAVFAMPRSRAEMVYRLTYANYVYRGNYVSEFRTIKERFTPEDIAVISSWLNAFDYLRHQLETEVKLNLPEFYDMALAKVPDGESSELKIHIQSPGEVSVQSKTPFALALMVMFALSACSPADIANDGIVVQLHTVGSASEQVRLDVETEANAMATALGQKRIAQAVALGSRAQQGAQMSTEATLKSGSSKGK